VLTKFRVIELPTSVPNEVMLVPPPPGPVLPAQVPTTMLGL
jgi:hypothetical protein